MDSVYYDTVAAEDQCRSEINALQDRIRRNETKPVDVRLSLPRHSKKCVTWLFFLYMPQEFRDLSALAYLGQLKLWEEAPATSEPVQNLRTWFCNGGTSFGNAPDAEAELVFGSFSDIPEMCTPDIRDYGEEDGVMFPGIFLLCPQWKNRDPFAGLAMGHDTPSQFERNATFLFTELLPIQADKSEMMQQFVAMDPSKMRGNEAIALRDKKPDWLATHEEFLTFAKLRAFPHTQIRHLLEALVDELLPFDQDCVHILVKQLLFHVGEDEWKTDFGFDLRWRGLELFAEEMAHQVNILRDSPKNCDKLLLFGAMSSFLGQYDSACLSSARGFAKISRGWADAVNEEVEHHGSGCICVPSSSIV